MPLEQHYDLQTAAMMRAELDRFPDTCHYDDTTHKIVYHSDRDAMEAYLALQRDEMERYRWIESEKQHADIGGHAFNDWVKRYSEQFSLYWRKTHAFIPAQKNDPPDHDAPQP